MRELCLARFADLLTVAVCHAGLSQANWVRFVEAYRETHRKARKGKRERQRAKRNPNPAQPAPVARPLPLVEAAKGLPKRKPSPPPREVRIASSQTVEQLGGLSRLWGSRGRAFHGRKNWAYRSPVVGKRTL